MAEPAIDDIRAHQGRLAETIAELLAEAQRCGASAAEAVASAGTGLEVSVRMGEVETVEHTRDNGLGVTVYFGRRKGSASTSDLSPAAIRDAVDKACTIARHTQEDCCAGLAPAELMADSVPDLDLYHPWVLSVEDAIDLALACEDAARAADPRIVNSEGASLSSHAGLKVYGNTHGFVGGYPGTRHGLSVAVIARDAEGGMERDYWWTSARAPGDLAAADSVGRRAAERAVARLGARRLPTGHARVLFRAEVAAGLLRHLLGAISGSSQYRKTSFLLDRLGERIFPDFVQVREDPLRLRGLASAPFDGDGVATRPKAIIQDGVLATYLLDHYSACKLGRVTTGNAGGARNLIVAMGEHDSEGMLSLLGTGLLVTELMGQGVNGVTGDYSRGATGFWVEDGRIAYPVQEITIASNLKDMYLGLLAVGNDCDFPGPTITGSWLIEDMTIAGD